MVIIVSCKCLLLALLLSALLLFSGAHSDDKLNGGFKVRSVNLGGWLVIEGWIKPSLFDGIPNGDMLDGAQVQFKSVTLNKYVSADNGGGSGVKVNTDVPSTWETFRLWRVTESVFQLRTLGGQFLSWEGEGSSVSARAESPSSRETFYIERSSNSNVTRVHIKLSTGAYLQANSVNELRTDYVGMPGWDDNAATFEMRIVSTSLHGDYQLANGYGHEKGKAVLEEHRSSFITAKDFKFLSNHGINTVRIPVGWWAAFDPHPPAPYIEGSLAYLDKAFSWAQANNLKCIIDLHAGPGSQNGMEHSSSRDGFIEWTKSENILKSLAVIDFLASRYAKQDALLGIELLNEPLASAVSKEIVVSYYRKGYEIVRKYSSTAYVLVSQRLGNVDQMELVNANIGTSNLVVDFHYYNLFDSYYETLSKEGNIQFIHKNRLPQVQALSAANGPLFFIGEWVNEWSLKNASQKDYQDYGKAQLEVYGAASFGWSYWTMRCNKTHWDLEWNIKNNYLQLGK